jgi:predicted TIM-barrel fold metal-dependent hydrolase
MDATSVPGRDAVAGARELSGSMIDVHTHLHPPRLFAAIRRWFAERSPWVLEHPTEPAEVAAALRAHGVETFVFCSYAHKPGMAAELNAWLAQTARELGPGAFALGTVHTGDDDPAADMRAALRDGCIGLKLHENVQRILLDDARLAPVLDEVAAAEGFVLVHVGAIPWSDETENGPQRIAAVLARHPTLRIVVAHFGIPDWVEYLALAAREPRLFLDTTMAFAHESPMQRPIDGAIVATHAAQIVYGTDWPNIPYAYDGDLRGLQALGLDDAALRAITRTNARRLSPALAARP